MLKFKRGRNNIFSVPMGFLEQSTLYQRKPLEIKTNLKSKQIF